MANGILSGGLPPGLAGFAAGRAQFQDDETRKLQGMLAQLSIQEMAETAPMKRALLAAQVKQIEDNLRMRQEALAGDMPAAQGALAQGAAVGDVGPTMSNAARIPQGLLSPQQRRFLLSGDPGLTALAKAELDVNKPMAAREGAPIVRPGTGEVLFYAPKLGTGIQPTFEGGRVTGASPVPGYSQAAASIAGAETSAQEGARAAHDIVQIPGQPVQTRAQLINRIAPAPQPTPTGGATPLLVPTPAATAGAVATATDRAEAGVKYESGIIEAGQKARGNLTTLQILAPNLEKLPTGPMYPLLAGGASYFKQFGIDVGAISRDLGTAQATDAILKQLALKTRDPAGGGMPGNMSDKDREFLVDSIPGLQKLPDGNRQLIEILTKLEQRKLDEASIVSRMQSAGKNSGEIREALTQFANSRPMFAR